MPNWCVCEIQVTGDAGELAAFMEKAKGVLAYENEPEKETCFTLNNFIPAPNNLGVQDTLDWCEKNWGTKWDLNEPSEDYIEGETEASFFCMSAWTPPTEALQAISGMYPLLKFSIQYEECGNAFEGVAIMQNGEMLESHENEMSLDEDEEE